MNTIARDIMKEFGLEGLPENEKQALVDQFSDVVMQAVMIRGFQALDEKQKDELDAALAKNPEDFDIILDFFMTNITDFDKIVQEEVTRIRERAKNVAPKG